MSCHWQRWVASKNLLLSEIVGLKLKAGRRTPIPNNLAAIRRALEDAGVEFIAARNGKGVGVRLSKDDPRYG